MICRKCGAELPDNTIRCPECGIKVNVYCPDCRTINLFGTTHCKKCGKELIKICPSCKSYNLTVAQKCRKCGTPFENYEEPENNEIYNNILPENEIVRPFCSQTNNYMLSGFYVFDTKYEQISNAKLQEEEENTNEKIFLEGANIQPEINYETELPQEILLTQQENNINKEENIGIESVEDIVIDVNDSLNEENEQDVVSQEEIPKAQEEIIEEEIQIQTENVSKIINILKTSINKQIIAINGEEGSGKSAILNQIKSKLTKDGYIYLYGSCTPLLQITSFGFFQDAFLRMLGFPPYIKNSESFFKEFKKSYYSSFFNCLDNNELNLFLNIFYPDKTDNFENILNNKTTMFYIIEKVITYLLLNNNIVIAIDNFELLDGASYDFIVHLIKKGFFNNRLKLIAAYQETKSIQSYFDLADIDDSIFETILIKKLQKEELISAVSKTLGFNIENIIPEEYLEELISKSNGNAIRLEQEIAFLFNIDYLTVENNNIVIKEDNRPDISPETFDELIKLRLNTVTPIIKNILFMAAIMGYRFSTSLLFKSLDINTDKAEEYINYLKEELFINYVDNYTCEFKSLTLWKIVYKEAKSDSLYTENSQRLYNSLKDLILSSNLQKLISCNDALNKDEEFEIWQDTASLTAKLGDTNLYVISQKQRLKLLDEINLDNSEDIRAEIYEQIGKLLCEKSPKEAITYLSNVLDLNIKESNLINIIDLSGYFIKSCYLTGNYFGVSEAVDTIISQLTSKQPDTSSLEIALIKTRKLPALLNIGNSEQIANIVNEEIIPELYNALEIKQYDNQYELLIINAWLEAKTSLAKAYAIQGNKKVFNTISQLRQFIDEYKYNIDYYSTQTDIIEAFANTISGNINKSNEILNNIYTNYKEKKLDTDLLALWNIVNVINRVFTGQISDLKTDLFELATFTNNINEHSIKNIIKLILGYILQKEGNKLKALEIYNEEITYFAKEKIAIGAMLSWALIVQINIEMGDFEKALQTATKSLEIAQSPKINNYFFSIYFQKFISEIYIHKQDLIASKMYLEKAISLAKKFDLKYQIIELYIAYGNYMEEFIRTQNSYSEEYIKLTYEMYSKAAFVSKELRLKNMHNKAIQAKSSFKVFCQLNSINL